jgi:hypothetical protein
MTACDNKDCEIEWFQFPCVVLKNEPNSSWFCSLLCKKAGKNNLLIFQFTVQLYCTTTMLKA